MGKRSSFERIPRDFYPTPVEAVRPLLPHLAPKTRFVEPCAGDGALVMMMAGFGHSCVDFFDIAPPVPHIRIGDATKARPGVGITSAQFDCFITNPPWERKVLHPIITNLSAIAPTWLLFDADWIHTRQSAPFIPLLRKIVSVGRVKWITDSPFTGKDNCAWHLFDASSDAPAQFIGRAA